MTHVEYLKSLGACESGILYAARFPTPEAAYAACASVGDLKWLLKAAHRAAYNAARAEHLATYEAARAEHLATYEAARAEHWAMYRAACDEHLAAYRASCDAYRASCDAHRAAYEAARDAHWAMYRAACAAIEACNTCDGLRERFACPSVDVIEAPVDMVPSVGELE